MDEKQAQATAQALLAVGVRPKDLIWSFELSGIAPPGSTMHEQLFSGSTSPLPHEPMRGHQAHSPRRNENPSPLPHLNKQFSSKTELVDEFRAPATATWLRVPKHQATTPPRAQPPKLPKEMIRKNLHSSNEWRTISLEPRVVKKLCFSEKVQTCSSASLAEQERLFFSSEDLEIWGEPDFKIYDRDTSQNISEFSNPPELAQQPANQGLSNIKAITSPRNADVYLQPLSPPPPRASNTDNYNHSDAIHIADLYEAINLSIPRKVYAPSLYHHIKQTSSSPWGK
jgi:hypothetical protein